MKPTIAQPRVAPSALRHTRYGTFGGTVAMHVEVRACNWIKDAPP